MTDFEKNVILREVLQNHKRMEHDKCSCGRGWLPEPYTYVDHVMAVYKEALSGSKD